MLAVDPDMTTMQLLKLAADSHHQRVALEDIERQFLVDLLRRRGLEELQYGEEVCHQNVRLIKRVTGAVGVYFR